MTRIVAISAAVVLAVGLAGMLYFAVLGGNGAGDDQFAQCRGGAIATGTEIGGPFELVNGDGETVTDQDVFTEPSILYFGYTFCPDVCPFDVARNAEAVDVLADRGISSTPVFITIDPYRDTEEVVKDYAYNMHEKMIGLTGSDAQIQSVSEAYRTYYNVHDRSDEFYLVDHSTFTYLVLPEHGFVEFFRREVTPEEMADRVACYVNNA